MGSRGQALVEFALVLPLLLFLVLGSMQVGVALMVRAELAHAAREGAIAGASAPAKSGRCGIALAGMAKVYGRRIQDTACDLAGGKSITVKAGLDLPLFIPGVQTWRISVTETALVR